MLSVVELSALPQRFITLAEVLLQELQRAHGPKLVSVAIFGSVARGVASPDSDLDVLIVADGLPKGRMSRVEQFLPVEEAVAARVAAARTLEIAPVFKTPEEAERGSPLFWDMTLDLLVLYDRDGVLIRLLDRVRRRLEALKARRVFRGNAWYWILKEDYRPGEVFEI